MPSGAKPLLRSRRRDVSVRLRGNRLLPLSLMMTVSCLKGGMPVGISEERLVLTTPIQGVLELVSRVIHDPRGSFQNLFRREDYQRIWGDRPIEQINRSRTRSVGAIRGLHLQHQPWQEAKLVRCLQGRVWDVAVDLRDGSPTYGHWHGVDLIPEQGNALLIPEGCAHGFQVLEPCSELLYLHSAPYRPEDETGVLWCDDDLAVAWPLAATDLSERDKRLPRLHDRK